MNLECFELVTYIEKAVESRTLLLKLAELHSLYVNCLGDLCIIKLVNKTRLKLDLLQHFPEAQEQCDGKTQLFFSNGNHATRSIEEKRFL